MREAEAERFAGAHHQLGGVGAGRVEPLDGVGDEDRERDAQWPGALQRVEADPDEAPPLAFSGDEQRRLGRVHERHAPERRLHRERLGDLHVVEIDEAQERVGVLPIDNGRRLQRVPAGKPVRVHDVNGQRVDRGPDGGEYVVEHGHVEGGGGIGQHGRNGQLDVWLVAQGLFEEPIATRNEQHSGRLRHEADDGGLVVGGQIVLGREMYGEHAVARLRGDEDEWRGVGGRQIERAHFDDLVVEAQFEFGLAGVGGEVADAGEDGPLGGVVGIGADVERDDAEVVAALADAMIHERQVFVLELVELGQRAVAKEMDFRVFLLVAVTDQGLREFQRLGDARGGIGGLARLQRAAQRLFVAGGGLFDFGLRGDLEHDHLIAVGQALHPLQGLGAGLLEARRPLIGGLHRGGGI